MNLSQAQEPISFEYQDYLFYKWQAEGFKYHFQSQHVAQGCDPAQSDVPGQFQASLLETWEEETCVSCAPASVHCIKPCSGKVVASLMPTLEFMETLKLPVSVGSNISLDSTYHLTVVRFTSELIDFSIEVKPYVPDVVHIVLARLFLGNGWKHLKFQIGPSVLSVL